MGKATAKVQGSRGGFAAIDEEVAAVLAFVISHTTFLASLEMTMRGLVSLGVLAFQSPATSPQSLVTS